MRIVSESGGGGKGLVIPRYTDTRGDTEGAESWRNSMPQHLGDLLKPIILNGGFQLTNARVVGTVCGKSRPIWLSL
jgi:hypothetical protein